MYEFKKESCAVLAKIVTKVQERHPQKYNFARKVASLDPRLIGEELDTTVKVFKQVLTQLVDTKWRTNEQARWCIDTSTRNLCLEMKQFHHEKCAGFKFGEDRLDAFFCAVLNTQGHMKIFGLLSGFF